MKGQAAVHATGVARGALLVAREYVKLIRASALRSNVAHPITAHSASHPPIRDPPATQPNPVAQHPSAHSSPVGLQTSKPFPASIEVSEPVLPNPEVIAELPQPAVLNPISADHSETLPQDEQTAVSSKSSYATAKEDEGPATPPASLHTVREVAVPESPLARVVGFGTLAAGLFAGAAAESARRAFGLGDSANRSGSAFVSEANAERLAASLSRMRGAALKLGQMLSIQDERVVPAPILRALERVRQGADIMPNAQLQRVLASAYGTDEWREALRVTHFEDRPIAAASIGQVHRGRIALDDDTEADVVFKIQYPGVARSISSDLNNLKRLVSVGNIIPDSLYIDDAIASAREELQRECDYEIEAASQARYRELLLASPLADEFYVPKVYPHASSKTVLVSEFVPGVPIDKISDPATKNRIGKMLLQLTLAELFEFGFQQSDPNFANFFYDEASGKMNLIDFGAAREYSPEFLREYLRLIEACARRDAERVLQHSEKLGFLTGEESEIMKEAHVKASFLVGEPFHESNLGGYNFAKSDIPARTAVAGRVMLKYRLTPPPKEAYSLHRRLSGAFLTSTRMGSTVDAAQMLNDTLERVIARERGEEVPIAL